MIHWIWLFFLLLLGLLTCFDKNFFNFLQSKPEYMRRRDFWDSSLEKRYNEYKKDATRPSLKVQLITKCILHNSSLPPSSYY